MREIYKSLEVGLSLDTAPPLSNNWRIPIIWLYIALNRIPNIDCYWVGALPKVQCSGNLKQLCQHFAL